jgi:hypothetical protein
MLGPQVGIVVSSEHNITYYRELFEYYTERLESIMSLYNVTTPDFIIIHIKEIKIIESLKIGRLSQIELPKRLINLSETKTKFNSNILPLTLEEKEFGFLLHDSLRSDYISNLINKLKKNLLYLPTTTIENNNSLLNTITVDLDNPDFQLKDETKQLLFLQAVKNSGRFKVFLSNKKHYLIISYLSNNYKYNYTRIVFHNKTGKLLFISKDSINNENLIYLNKDTSNHYVRESGNLSVALNQYNDIELFIKKIELPYIKYKEHNKIINQESNHNKSESGKPIPRRNPKFGVFDVETFLDTTAEGDKYSRVYALGFCIYMQEVSMYYLSDSFDNSAESSNKLVLKCIDAMLQPEYHKYVFYVHNFGRFDSIFLHKILLDHNLTAEAENQYRLVPLYRDNIMIRLEVIKKIKTKKIKISFVDSLNILNGKLETLCEDFSVSTTKGIFPYSFVNKDNLDYIGPTPDISYYNTKINKALYKENIKQN